MDKTKAGTFSPLTFFQEVKEELIKVNWPTREQTVRLTVIVITISLAVGIFIGALDYLFTGSMSLILKK